MQRNPPKNPEPTGTTFKPSIEKMKRFSQAQREEETKSDTNILIEHRAKLRPVHPKEPINTKKDEVPAKVLTNPTLSTSPSTKNLSNLPGNIPKEAPKTTTSYVEKTTPSVKQPNLQESNSAKDLSSLRNILAKNKEESPKIIKPSGNGSPIVKKDVRETPKIIDLSNPPPIPPRPHLKSKPPTLLDVDVMISQKNLNPNPSNDENPVSPKNKDPLSPNVDQKPLSPKRDETQDVGTLKEPIEPIRKTSAGNMDKRKSFQDIIKSARKTLYNLIDRHDSDRSDTPQDGLKSGSTTPISTPKTPSDITIGPIPKDVKQFKEELSYSALDVLLGATKFGFLEKRGQAIKNWKTRFFVLVNHMLFYFEDEKAKEAKGLILLHIPDCAQFVDREKFQIAVTTSSRTYFLIAGSLASAEGWIQCMNQSVKYQQKDVEKIQKKEKKLMLDRDYTGYQVNFFCVFSIPEIMKEFYQHLYRECNTEPFDFLLEMERMGNEISVETIEKFNSICELYISSDAKKTVNISGTERAKVLQFARGNSKTSWTHKQSPLEILEPIRKLVLTDLKGEPWPRFLASGNGFDIISKFHYNPEVITQDPMYLVMYKMRASFYGDKFEKDDELKIFAWNLSDRARIKKTYLNFNWGKTQKLEKKLRSSFSEQEGEENDEEIFGVSQKPLSGSIKVKLLIMEKQIKETSRAKIKNYLSPIFTIMSSGDEVDHESEKYNIALLIGPWLLSWDQSGICVPKRCVSTAALISADLDSICIIKSLEEKIDKLTEILVHWNCHMGYSAMSLDRQRFGNSLDFVESVLEAMEINTVIPRPIRELIDDLQKTGFAELRFEMNPEFQKKFSTKPKVIFKTHIELDEFMYKLLAVDPHFEKNYKDEYLYLKAIDRAYWMKHIKVQDDIIKIRNEKKKLVFEKYDQISETERLDKELKRKIEELIKIQPLQKVDGNWSYYDCPFGDPLKRQSIIL